MANPDQFLSAIDIGFSANLRVTESRCLLNRGLTGRSFRHQGLRISLKTLLPDRFLLLRTESRRFVRNPLKSGNHFWETGATSKPARDWNSKPTGSRLISRPPFESGRSCISGSKAVVPRSDYPSVIVMAIEQHKPQGIWTPMVRFDSVRSFSGNSI
jgi:hypothetical protein